MLLTLTLKKLMKIIRKNKCLKMICGQRSIFKVKDFFIAVLNKVFGVLHPAFCRARNDGPIRPCKEGLSPDEALQKIIQECSVVVG